MCCAVKGKRHFCLGAKAKRQRVCEVVAGVFTDTVRKSPCEPLERGGMKMKQTDGTSKHQTADLGQEMHSGGAENAFLCDNGRRATMISLNEQYEYGKIRRLAEEYLQQESRGGSGNALEVLECAKAQQALLEKCRLVRAEAGDAFKIFYEGIEAVSQSICCVPCINSEKAGPACAEVTFGFVAVSWIFFESYNVKAGHDILKEVRVSHNEAVREVVGRHVHEAHTIPLSAAIVKVAQHAEAAVQFAAFGNGKQREQILTPQEKEAVLAIAQIEKGNRVMKGMLQS